jgi:hypothetical protein
MFLSTIFETLHRKLLSTKTKERAEKAILSISIASFVIHLTLIYLVDLEIISIGKSTELLNNPIAALYTPFSFILVYEVYLLIFYLPQSFTTYISKQYEIMTLIIIRRLFKDLSNITLTNDWFTIKYDLQFTYDLVTSVLLFFLIYLFFVQSRKMHQAIPEAQIPSISVQRFINFKKMLATALVPVFAIVSAYSFFNWLSGVIQPNSMDSDGFTNINNIFFEQFFTILIFADVLLLLFSFYLTDQFHKVIRNSGFILSTILIRLSFSTTGLLNNLLIVCGIVFGLLILVIHNRFEKEIAGEKKAQRNASIDKTI